jgi:hypothetical protein
MIPEGLIVGCGIEACRRILARNPDDPVKVVNSVYGFYEASRAVNTHPGRLPSWVQLEPGGLDVTVRAMLAAVPPAGAAEAAVWQVGYPTLEVKTGSGADRVLETSIDHASILGREFRVRLEEAFARALSVAYRSRPVRTAGGARRG